ncbi:MULTISPECIES: malonic semialdehyde reductase [Micromonospora]|uniref:Malonic semialdehyde reductase n=1 Tax=Micromonospora solifontis TaxID=2487138 RepID=A0ABX9WK84_9ACTN|nr:MULTISPECIES: malonic semialdehyde reductase [Micromonospora]NES13686.1 malonic semialdehyde reductase [Micromonospora sp. PPF5-17B]NES35495.1 malonic semialdehyde reductase [Micromonospora solifontis]NES55348.1 malonic semialdehyde reductase [Micromonospora sp. PPF5-6]RNM00742.1 malonic semialdehyde reductase [Micromonospora solifontis]
MSDLITLHPEAQAQLFTDARTANTFTDEPVSDEQLHAIFELAKYPPTAANTQPLRVLFIRQGEARERLLTHLSEGNRAKTASAPVVAVLAADTEFHEFIPRVFPIRPEMRDGLAADAVAREGMARFNATLQIGYWLLAVRAAGLAAGPMAGFDTEGLDKEFFADSSWKSLLVVNIGKPGPDAWFPRLPRLDYDDVVRHA